MINITVNAIIFYKKLTLYYQNIKKKKIQFNKKYLLIPFKKKYQKNNPQKSNKTNIWIRVISQKMVKLRKAIQKIIKMKKLEKTNKLKNLQKKKMKNK